MTLVVSEKIGRKAVRLVDDHRVYLWQRARTSEMYATVSGDFNFHRVLAQEDRVYCDCKAWRDDRYCSHAVAAMIAWGEQHAD